MTDKRTQESADKSNMEKDPADWVTGDEPMTGAQRSYLKTLSEEAKVPFDDKLSKADASRRIDELQEITGRGTSQGKTDSEGTGDSEGSDRSAKDDRGRGGKDDGGR
jgi:hypothetical protein